MNDNTRLLAGRYELGDLIGRGGMAEVHVGYDTRLGRTVAIKVLRADLARDPSFQTRFRREAQAAAGLNHPAIVAVYDTGEDIVDHSGHPTPFIVMEYVEGHTVRDILKGDVAAPIDEAVEIVSGVLLALEYAHNAGLVHRDIKPANVMLTPTGAVKVMDFGIARAMADVDRTMTQTQAVVGTAQYLSPEQARGENVDYRSDLYSAGCLLFELLAGRPPFIGDSPVSVAVQHVRNEPPHPSEFASDVPPELDQVCLRALAKDRDKRYATAQEFLADLRAAMSGAPLAPDTGAIPVAGAAAALGAGALLAGGAAAAANAEDGDATQVMGEDGGTAVMPTQQWGAVGAAGAAGVPGSVPPPQTGSIAVSDEEDLEDDPDATRRKILLWGGLGVAALIILGIIIGLIATSGSGADTSPSPSVSATPIPTDVVGMEEDEARALLEELGFVVEVQTEASTEVDEGLVIRTEPEAGEEAEIGSTVTLIVSAGPDVIVIPDVEGYEEAQATEILEELGLTVRIEESTSPTIEQGRAVGTDPALDSEVEPGSSVTLLISNGLVDLPDLTGGSESAARSTLTELNLTPDIQYIETGEADPGTVLDQTPAAGEVNQRSTVQLVVAEQVQNVTVPNVVGFTSTAAQTELTGEGLGYQYGPDVYSNTVTAGSIVSQDIPAGTRVEPNTVVTLVKSLGPEPQPTVSPTP